MDPSINATKASDGSGNANTATVQSVRAALATTIEVDTVTGINTDFVATMGTPHTFEDPVTGEEITVISEETAVDFRGHVDGSNLEIDEIAPGYTDEGSEVGDIVIIRPTTYWSNLLAEILEVSHNDDGTLKVANGGSIDDGAGNEQIKFTQTASAVNELTVKNAATGNSPELQVTGDDTNIGLKGVPKGSGIFRGFLAVKVGSIAPTGNGQASVTGLGFKPKFLVMHHAPGSSTTVLKATEGFSDGTTTFSKGIHGVEGGDISRNQSTTLICFNISSNAAIIDEITLDSLDADGFTYTKADHQATETFYYIAYG